MDTNSLPVGTILAYPLDTLPSDFSASWMVCQGAEMNKMQYPELFNAIGYCNGSSGDPSVFYLPNLQGCFLRGVDPAGKVDLESNKRTGVRGDKAAQLPGSVQGFATASPSQLALQVPNLPDGYHHLNQGDSGPLAYMMMEYNPGYVDYPVQLPSAETAPVNTYMQYIIKVKPSVALPTGAIISYAGSPIQAPDPFDGNWAPCEGDAYRTTTRLFQELYRTLGGRYGISPDGSEFYVPNLQGMFIRGVDVNSGRDKNGNRHQPIGLSGVTAPAAGSTQAFGTAQANSPLVARLWHVGLGATVESFKIAGRTSVRGDDNTNAQYWSGGDQETRPVNANVMFFLAMRSQDPTADMVPVGTITAIAGETAPSADYWALCDGSSVENKKYPQLFTACGTIWGAQDSDHFYLPDLRGRFLRGVDNTPPGSVGIDPDRNNRKAPQSGSGSTKGVGSVQDWGTSINGWSINISLPTRNWQNAATAVGDQAENYHPDNTPCQILGGDVETRPINIAVNFYIKVAAVAPAF
ncbi:hypothetical protein, variant [Exophiala xenobiotica]|uniref:Phage tail collar domain-containing protein n=1 Tax=Exophiala xenobiotica TaxID=348802 RepID=A0A0D2CLW9_9EURO|nr:hypothetical protein, variant [Exophiala xenobiotica]XP_013311446.1 uncharacterized protein PV05_09644 [Exophiala xenobiotica]KIW50861.1 hypothetical protein PV05_09644 [Exophiala xenobiotica]KIW50862.1 hypothetical protein, variant [Exophiala xenobiotica]